MILGTYLNVKCCFEVDKVRLTVCRSKLLVCGVRVCLARKKDHPPLIHCATVIQVNKPSQTDCQTQMKGSQGNSSFV